jgi:uncharacterized repeat protein (TIGR02543 family)
MKKFFLDGFVVLTTLLIIFSLAMPVQAQTPLPPTPDTTLPNDMPEVSPLPPGGEGQLAPQVVANASPVITIWYENSLNFGQLGNPQRQVNILGNISDPDSSISSLSYSLNNGASISLPIGPSGSIRLVNQGDFNVAIDITSLRSGSNTVVLTGKDSGGATTTKTVIFQYTPSHTWPIPYSTTWASAGAINNQAQVVDGKWNIVQGGVRVEQQGYDRVIAIGDMSWKDYEILVPITVYAFYPDPTNPDDGGGAGVIARWQGHTGGGVLPSDWRTMGAYGYYSNRYNGLALRINGNTPPVQNFAFQYGTTYLFKLRAETVPTGGKYSLKVWVKGQPEPPWNTSSNLVGVVDSNGDLPTGSILLVAHRADALFGDVTICPFNVSYGLKVNINGSGNVSTSPNKTSFACGEGVTLTPTAAPGWVFKNWSGDINSTSPSLSFNMTKAYTLTANFERSGSVVLGTHAYLPFVRR